MMIGHGCAHHMHWAASSSIRIICQTALHVHGACALILMIMPCKGHIYLHASPEVSGVTSALTDMLRGFVGTEEFEGQCEDIEIFLTWAPDTTQKPTPGPAAGPLQHAARWWE